MTEAHHVAESAIQRLSMVPPAIWIVSGPPGPGRDSVTQGLLGELKRAAHIDGDALAEAIAGGRVLPDEEPQDEADRQIELSMRNQCLLARSYAEAGFSAVIDYAVVTRSQLEAYRHYLAGGQIRLVVALDDTDTSAAAELMRDELRGIGLWASGADAATILEAERDASVS